MRSIRILHTPGSQVAKILALSGHTPLRVKCDIRANDALAANQHKTMIWRRARPSRSNGLGPNSGGKPTIQFVVKETCDVIHIGSGDGNHCDSPVAILKGNTRHFRQIPYIPTEKKQIETNLLQV
jgi:hypothetical protein